MKSRIFSFTILLTILSIAIGSERIDVIQLNNGDIIKGIIIENVPNDYIRIELQGGSILSYKYDDMEKLLKETKETESVPQPQSSSMSYSQKMLTYQTQKRSQGSAMVFSILLPTAGHAYAGNWIRGIGFFAAEVGLMILGQTSGISRKCETKISGYGNYTYSYVDCDQHLNPLFFIGTIGSIATKLYEIIDAGKEVKRLNLKLYNRLFLVQSDFGINIRPHKDGANLMLTYNF